MVKIFNATIVLTNRCNLRCVYCYEKQAGSDFSGKDISEEILVRSFEFLVSHIETKKAYENNTREYSNPDLLSVYLWGGEPTLRPDLIEFAIKTGNDLAQKAGKKIKWRISTNGVLVDDKIAEIIKDCEIYLSVDDNNIVQRKTRGVSAEYLKNDVWQKTLKDSYVVVRIVNHPKYASGMLLDQVQSLMDLGFTKFYPSSASGYGWPEIEFKILEKDYETLTKWHFENKIEVPNLNEYFRENTDGSKTVVWTGDKTVVCVTVDGDVYPSDLEAYLKVSKIGNVLDGIDESMLVKVAKERGYQEDKHNVCGECLAKRYCPGYGSAVYYKNAGKPVPYYYQDCCGEYLAKIRSWYRIKHDKEPVNAVYLRLANVNR
jgi:uncharacterized protein